MKGYCGRILHVDLTSGKFMVEQPDEAFYRKYVGGSALGTYYVLKGMRPGIDAFDQGNVIVFATSCTTGAPISGASRHNVTAKSPLTGGIGDSQGGGFWGPELKFAGFDAVVITGKSMAPCFIWIHDGDYELVDATGIWGLETGPAQDAIRARVGEPKARVALIGPAGEKLVRYACIGNELKHYNGRNGLGAVMGSKNLKAIAVRGTGKPEFADRDAIIAMAQTGAKKAKESPMITTLTQHGTARTILANQATGGLPTRNWTSGFFEQAESISGERMTETILKKNEACWACAVRCKRVVELEEPYAIDPKYGGPEYESVSSLGSYLAIWDLPAIAKANELCNRYGIDTISAGGTIAFAMECFEKGLLTTEDTGGLELRFGNPQVLLELLPLIAKREGIGNILAEGAARAAERIGKGSTRYAVCCKKQEFPAHMPGVKASLSLAYAINPFGADHMSTAHDPAISATQLSEDVKSIGFDRSVPISELNFEKAKLVAYTQRLYSAVDTLDLCMFCFGFNMLYGPKELVDLVRYATGWNVSLWELMLVGERRINMMREFNAYEGFTQEDDMPPSRLFEPLSGGASDGNKISKDEFMDTRSRYYELMGWDSTTGKASLTKLRELGLEWIDTNNKYE